MFGKKLNKKNSSVTVKGKIENIHREPRVKIEYLNTNNEDTLKIMFKDIPFEVSIDHNGELRSGITDKLTNEFQKVLKAELESLTIELAEKLKELQS